MNVLLTGLMPPDTIGGTQSWNATVGAELAKRGHTVFYWAEIWTDDPPLSFDLGIVSQGSMGVNRSASNHCERSINVSHGIIDQEAPMPDADAYVFVSEEARDHWDMELTDTGFHRSSWGHVIRQPIDCDFWSPVGVELPDNPKTYIYRHSYYGGLEWLRETVEDLGYEYQHGTDETRDDVRRWILGAAVVISSGRGALEAMACGRPTIICDHRPYNGSAPMTYPVRTRCAFKTNYSGRGGIEATPEIVRDQIKDAMYGNRDWRDTAIGHHAAPMIVDELLATVGLS